MTVGTKSSRSIWRDTPTTATEPTAIAMVPRPILGRMSQVVESWKEHTHTVLERAGHRRGGARAAVINLLAGQPCALTAQEIEDALRAQGRSVGRASVYRVLELLVEHGAVGRLEVGQGTARYETLDPGGEHHHHLVCARCGRLVPFDDSDLERSIERLADRLGFRVDAHEVVLRGTCERCEPVEGEST